MPTLASPLASSAFLRHNSLMPIPAHSVRTGPDTPWIVEQATVLGFDLCGVVRAEKFPELHLAQEWLARGYAGEMKYLADDAAAILTVRMPGIRSVIVCALNYNSPAPRSLKRFHWQRIPSRAAGFPAMLGERTTTKF